MAVNFPDMEDGLSATLGDELNSRFNALKNAVNLALQNRGNWNSATPYEPNDVVFDGAGAAWLCLANNTNSPPAPGSNWRALGGASSGGGSYANYTHTQSVAATTWTVTHNLGRRPSVTVIDSAGTRVFGGESHQNTNQLTLTFSAPFAGTALCN